MHELSVCLSMLQQVQRIAGEHDGKIVSRIVVRVGPLSGVEPELLRHAYPIAAAATVAENAVLSIDTINVVVHCVKCDTDTRAEPNRLLCANCGDFRTRIVSGDELILDRVELEESHGPVQRQVPKNESFPDRRYRR